MSSSSAGSSLRAAANARRRTMWPLIGMRRPTHSSLGTSLVYGRGFAVRLDAVMDDFERSRRRSPRPPRDSGRARARWRCARAQGGDGAIGERRSTAISRNSLKPCFVEKRIGTCASVPARSPYTSACTRCVCRIVGRVRTRYADDARERDRVDVRADEDGVERDAARPRARGRNPMRPPRSRAA